MLESLLNRGSMPVLQQVMSFTEARQEVLVNNITNFDTVGYKMKDLSPAEFGQALDQAIECRNQGGVAARLQMRSTKNLSWDSQGRLTAKPAEIENSNILFHDRNNRFVEKQMAAMSQNAMLHNMAAELLRNQYQMLEMAIRGRS